jgi:hypothetical protein
MSSPKLIAIDCPGVLLAKRMPRTAARLLPRSDYEHASQETIGPEIGDLIDRGAFPPSVFLG